MPQFKKSTRSTAAPYDLVIGDCYYKHKETGVEIRLSSFNGKEGSDPECVKLVGFDKFSNVYNLTEAELYRDYDQNRHQADFTDPVDPRLPYVFDLFWDVKTVSQLKDHIEEEGMDAELEKQIREHGIQLDQNQTTWL